MSSVVEATSSVAPPRADRRTWWGMVVLMLPTILLSVDVTVLHLAAPSISRDLHAQGDQLLWILDIYGFFIASFLMVMGALGDRIGRRRMLLCGGVLFALASLLAAFAPTVGWLIVARALLGVAGATLMPSTLALIRVMFHHERERTLALSMWMGGFMVGSSMGPLVGGVLLEFFWWGSVFLIALPVMAILLLAGPRLLPEYRDPAPGPLDPLSVVLSAGAMLLLIYAVKQGALRGADLMLLLAALGGLTCAILFVVRQGRLSTPMLDLGLFRNPRFSASIAATGLTVLAISGLWYLVFQYLQAVRGLSPLHSGLVVLPAMIGQLLLSLSVTRLQQYLSDPVLVLGGLTLALIGFIMMALIRDQASFLWIGVSSALMSMGVMPLFVLGTDFMLGAVPEERAGVASALSETANELGMALGVALVGSLAGFVYRLQMMPTLPAGLSEDQRNMVGTSISSLLAVLDGLPQAELLLARAVHAFGEGFRLNAWLSVLLILLVMAMVRRYLLPRGYRRQSGPV